MSGHGRRPRRRDREEERRRARAAERARREKESFDPAPPDDEDWVIGEGSGLRRITGPAPVGDALDAFLAGSGWRDRVRATRLLDDWPALVGPHVADHCRPVRIDRGELVVEAESHAWATQLTWLEADLRRKVNEAAGEVVVHRIRVTVAGGPEPDTRRPGGWGRPGR